MPNMEPRRTNSVDIFWRNLIVRYYLVINTKYLASRKLNKLCAA